MDVSGLNENIVSGINSAVGATAEDVIYISPTFPRSLV